jgi:transcriptional regulator with XRE-family HTH domain
MEEEKLKKQIGSNIASYRKRMQLTQAGLAEKLNYSDKAISKWERGESAPDVQTLVQLADLFDVTVNDLLVDPDALPENPGADERVLSGAVERTLKRKADKRVILSLAGLLVGFVSLLLFVVLSSLDIPNTWLAFIYGIPACAIVLLSLRSAWKDFRWNQLLVSLIMWGGILSVYLSMLVFLDLNWWKLFLLGIPGQAAIILWSRLYRKQHKEEVNG